MRKNKKKKYVNSVHKSTDRADLDYNKLTESIVKANEIIDSKAQSKAENINKEKRAEWERVIGYKPCPNEENLFVRYFYKFRNTTLMFFNLITFKKEDTLDDVSMSALLRLALIAILTVVKWMFYIAAIVLACKTGYDIHFKEYSFLHLYIPIAIVSFFIGRMVRIAAFEAENIEDKNYMITILSAITSLIAMVVAVAAIFVR